MKRMRRAILENRFEEFKNNFVENYKN